MLWAAEGERGERQHQRESVLICPSHDAMCAGNVACMPVVGGGGQIELLQDDTSRCSLGYVDIKSDVTFKYIELIH